MRSKKDLDKEQERLGLGARKIGIRSQKNGSQEDRKMGARKIGTWSQY